MSYAVLVDTSAFTLDRHFRQFGFEVAPAPAAAKRLEVAVKVLPAEPGPALTRSRAGATPMPPTSAP